MRRRRAPLEVGNMPRHTPFDRCARRSDWRWRAMVEGVAACGLTRRNQQAPFPAACPRPAVRQQGYLTVNAKVQLTVRTIAALRKSRQACRKKNFDDESVGTARR